MKKKSDERRALVPLSRCLIAAWQELSLLEPFSSGLTIQTRKLKWAAWKLHQKLDDLVWQRGSICASFRGTGCCTRGAIVSQQIAKIIYLVLCIYELIVLEKERRRKDSIQTKNFLLKNPTLEPDFQQSQNAGGSGMSSIPLMNPILEIKLRLL